MCMYIYIYTYSPERLIVAGCIPTAASHTIKKKTLHNYKLIFVYFFDLNRPTAKCDYFIRRMLNSVFQICRTLLIAACGAYPQALAACGSSGSPQACSRGRSHCSHRRSHCSHRCCHCSPKRLHYGHRRSRCSHRHPHWWEHECVLHIPHGFRIGSA